MTCNRPNCTCRGNSPPINPPSLGVRLGEIMAMGLIFALMIWS